ncbi:MAG: hypothetical protein JOZ78_15310 [Chroococcidiopsidaceae cyanobacterium CP_BM_ER_R8_30]|nr:hypothetical protein [Chroococcidiopsidaceae cyanobacterium CP_BM_ER_R8_30]
MIHQIGDRVRTLDGQTGTIVHVETIGSDELPIDEQLVVLLPDGSTVTGSSADFKAEEVGLLGQDPPLY